MQTAPVTYIAGAPSATDRELDAIMRVFGVSQAEIARFVGTTPRTVSRWRSASRAHSAPRPKSERSLRELARLRWLLESDLGQQGTRDWLRTPNPAFRGIAPMDVLLDGEVDRVLGLVISLGEGGLF